MYFDEASNQKGYGVEIVLVYLDGARASFIVKLNFTITNNVSKYKACIIRFEIALGLGVRRVEIFGDSNLIIS